MANEKEILEVELTQFHLQKMQELVDKYSLQNKNLEKLWEISIDFYQKLSSEINFGKIIGIELIGNERKVLPIQVCFESSDLPDLFDPETSKGKSVNFSHLLLDITLNLLRQGGKFIIIDNEVEPPTGSEFKHEVFTLLKSTRLN